MPENFPLVPSTPEPSQEEPSDQSTNEQTPITLIERLSPIDPEFIRYGEQLQKELVEAADYEATEEILERYVTALGYETVEEMLLLDKIDNPEGSHDFYLEMLETLNVRATLRTPESITQEPSPEDMAKLESVVEQFDDEVIAYVSNLSFEEIDVPVERMDPERKRMMDGVASVYQMVREILTATNVIHDTEQTKYPDFWKNLARYEILYLAVGKINRTEGRVNRELGVRRD